MTQSPGYKNDPAHKIQENVVRQRVQVAVDAEVIADSTEVTEVAEDHHPKRLYFPRSDVRTDVLVRSSTRTVCPFKGEASYFHIDLNGTVLEDAVWTYENPYDEHRALKDRMAFYRDKYPIIHIEENG